MPRPARRQGFTLIELSIALAIIGLLIGGVMAGRSLMRASQLKTVIDELNRYGVAFQNFETEFAALPGDMSNATSYWGSASGDGYNATCYGIDKTSALTCNGNGDRSISITNPMGGNDGLEGYLAWHHLAAAGMIGGTYTGRGANAGAYGSMGGTSTPQSKMTGGTYYPYSFGNCYSSNATYFDGCYYGVSIWVGTSILTTWMPDFLFTPDEMLSIDRKMDDGLPGYGQLRARKADSSCIIDASNYKLTVNTVSCRGIYYINPVRQN